MEARSQKPLDIEAALSGQVHGVAEGVGKARAEMIWRFLLGQLVREVATTYEGKQEEDKDFSFRHVRLSCLQDIQVAYAAVLSLTSPPIPILCQCPDHCSPGPTEQPEQAS